MSPSPTIAVVFHFPRGFSLSLIARAASWFGMSIRAVDGEYHARTDRDWSARKPGWPPAMPVPAPVEG